MKQEISRNYWF